MSRHSSFQMPRIDMTHGAGGKATHALIEGLFVPAFSNPSLTELTDAAVIPDTEGQLVMSTDAFVVQPLKFPGGSIGSLAIHGTVNDLVVSGAKPLGISVAMILEEGLDSEVLKREVEAMAQAARTAGVSVCTGDTKVVQRGHGDGIYMITTGIGRKDPAWRLSAREVRPGDKIICSGTIGDHGVAILIARGELELEGEIRSDSQSLIPFVGALKESAAGGVRWMRDPTRGGIGTTLNELAQDSHLGVLLYEEQIPIREEVHGACEILGIDPLYVANEGKLLVVVSPELAEEAVESLRKVPGGEQASIIGEILSEPAGRVLMKTSMGGTRIIDMLVGDPLPRIC